MTRTPGTTTPTSSTSAMVPWLARVTRVIRESADTVTLHLARTQHAAPMSFAPGQFNMVYLFGTGEVPLSLSGDPAHPEEIQHTVRAVGAVTRPLAAVRTGTVLGVRGPYGRGWPLEAPRGEDVLFVAGGIGLAPIRPAIYHVLRHRHAFGRVVILYGARSPEDLLYVKELERWRERFDIDVRVSVDRSGPDWRADVGVVPALIPAMRFDPLDTVAMVCGPEVMMRFTARELDKRGVAATNIYVSVERNMQCGVGWCGHCQLGPVIVCRDGPVFRFDRIAPFLGRREA